MTSIKRSALLPCRPQQLFDPENDIEACRFFLGGRVGAVEKRVRQLYG